MYDHHGTDFVVVLGPPPGPLLTLSRRDEDCSRVVVSFVEDMSSDFDAMVSNGVVSDDDCSVPGSLKSRPL